MGEGGRGGQGVSPNIENILHGKKVIVDISLVKLNKYEDLLRTVCVTYCYYITFIFYKILIGIDNSELVQFASLSLCLLL